MADREITFYPNNLTTLLSSLKAKQRGITTDAPADPNNESIWEESKGWLTYKDTDGDSYVVAVQKYYDTATSSWIRKSNVFADLEVEEIYTEVGLIDQFLVSPITISESGVTVLDAGFTATSIVGCLNELFDAIVTPDPFWKALSADTIAPRDEDGYDFIFVNSGLKDQYCSGIPLAESGETGLDPIFTATSIIGALNELSGGVDSLWERDNVNGYLYPKTLTDYVGIGKTAPAAKLDMKDGDIYLTGTSIAHGITAYLPTDVYSSFGIYKSGVGGGGLLVHGIGGDTTTAGITLRAIMGSDNPTDTAAAFYFSASKKNGANIQNLGAAETCFQFANGSTALVTVLGNGNVGIGCTPASYKVDVESATTSVMRLLNTGDNDTGLILSGNRAASNNIVGVITGRWNNNTVAQIRFMSGSDAVNKDDGYITFWTSDNASTVAECVRITPVGNVGIGTTAPNFGGVTKALTISAGTSGTNQAFLELQGSRNGETNKIFAGIDLYNGANNSCGVCGVRETADDDGALAFYTKKTLVSISEKMRITGVGNVGIGTTAPGAKCEITTDAGVLSNLYVTDNRAYDTVNLGGCIFWRYKYNSAGSYTEGAGIVMEKESEVDGEYPSALKFFTRQQGSSALEKVRITSTGYVGIGTVAPVSLFHISKAQAGETKIIIENDNSSGSCALELYTTTSGAATRLVHDDANNHVSLEYGQFNEFRIRERGTPQYIKIYTDLNQSYFIENSGNSALLLGSNGHTSLGIRDGYIQIIDNSTINVDWIKSNTYSCLYNTNINGGAYPFTTSGNLVIQARTSELRDVIIAGGNGTPSPIAIFKSDLNSDFYGNIVLKSNKNISSGSVNLSDDTATSFTPGKSHGMLCIHCQTSCTSAIIAYDVDGAVSIAITAQSGTTFAVTTGALSGTTGTDGKFNVSVYTDGKIYLENRTGGI